LFILQHIVSLKNLFENESYKDGAINSVVLNHQPRHLTSLIPTMIKGPANDCMCLHNCCLL